MEVHHAKGSQGYPGSPPEWRFSSCLCWSEFAKAPRQDDWTANLWHVNLFSHILHIQHICLFFTYFAYFQTNFSWPGKKYHFFCPSPVPKKKDGVNPCAPGAMTGMGYNLILHCTVGHASMEPYQTLQMAKRLLTFLPRQNVFAPHKMYIFDIFCIFWIFCIFDTFFCFKACLASVRRGFGIISWSIGVSEFHFRGSCGFLPKFVPKTDADIDELLSCKLEKIHFTTMELWWSILKFAWENTFYYNGWENTFYYNGVVVEYTQIFLLVVDGLVLRILAQLMRQVVQFFFCFGDFPLLFSEP
jgi:hypothetical protein